MTVTQDVRELQQRLNAARVCRIRAVSEANAHREQAAMYGRAGLDIPSDISAALRALSRRSAGHAWTEASLRGHLYELTGTAFPEDGAAP